MEPIRTVTVYTTVIRATATYTCQTWIMNKTKEEKIRRWEL
jgi:hypothetical protein